MMKGQNSKPVATHVERVTHECLETHKNIVERVPPPGFRLPDDMPRFQLHLKLEFQIKTTQGPKPGTSTKWVPAPAATVQEAIALIPAMEEEYGPILAKEIVDSINAEQQRVIGPEEAKRMAAQLWDQYGKGVAGGKPPHGG